MRTVFRKAIIPDEIRSLLVFDRKVFNAADRFPAGHWTVIHSYWMLVNDIKVGCCAFEKHVDFQQDLRDDGVNPRMPGSLYIATTGILPRFQNRGFGRLLKSWQIAYARHHGFHRIVTNTRKQNKRMIQLNRSFGFKLVRTTAGYYSFPVDATVVMELRLAGS